MRIRTPTSRSAFPFRLSSIDAIWAAVAPGLALLLRDPSAFTPWSPGNNWGADQVIGLWTLLIVFSLFSFMVFRIRDGFTIHFSVGDAMDVAKAVVLTEALIIGSLFTLTRLEAIPRSIPFIHGLLLAFGLVAARIVFRLVKQDRPAGNLVPSQDQEHVIFIGATRLTALFIQILEVCSPKSKVMGVLDASSNAGGQSISSTRVIGSPEQLEVLVEEFMEHGIRTDRVLIGCPLTSMPSETLKEIEAACNRREIELAYIPELIGVVNSSRSEVFDEVARDDVVIPVYFQVKRFVEPIIALTLLALASPLFLLVALLVFLNLGRPLFFWQRRLGRRGQPFLIHKFRTMKPIVDNSVNSIVDEHRGSWIGDLLRRTHLDELPQLLNVIVGDMSLIGPRPLLPHDQPSGHDLRLMVKPGITGWAQVNGGKSLSSSEKGGLDVWYVRKASLGLDIKILLMTLSVVFSRRANRHETKQDIPPIRSTPQTASFETALGRRSAKRRD